MAELSPTGTRCLNCGAPLHGPFCSHCTQRHALPEDLGLRGMVSEGPRELWRKLVVLRDTPNLLFRPGHLLRAYLEGRRIRHAHPWALFATWWALSLVVAGWLEPSDQAWIEDLLSAEQVAEASANQLQRLHWLSWLTGLAGQASQGLAVVAAMPAVFRLLLGPDPRGMLPYTVLALHIGAFGAVLEIPLQLTLTLLEQTSTAVMLGGFSFVALGAMLLELLYVMASVRWGLGRPWSHGLLVGLALTVLLYVVGVVAVFVGMLVVLMLSGLVLALS